MTTYKSTQVTARKRIVIKLGGSTLEQLNEQFFKNFKALQEDYDLVITHGGGPAINRALKKANIESTTVNGLRVTTDEMIDIVQTTLIGEVNPYLVSQLTRAGIQAIGLNGFDAKLLTCTHLDEAVYGHVGEVTNIAHEAIEQLLQAGFVPVIACIGATENGQALNINGDTVASEVALSIQAESLLLVTDVSGIRIEDTWQTEATKSQIDTWIEEGHIYGGMIPKVQGALDCLAAGIPTVQIVNDQLTGTTIIGG
ncbi:MAG: acetylglutamate kinase [Caryophanon sp.]|nr:acetylglutamate kinase [Caryophanon sp.]